VKIFKISLHNNREITGALVISDQATFKQKHLKQIILIKRPKNVKSSI